MITGLSAGIFWALDTVILGVALAMTPFVSDKQAIFLAPFISTFLHDAFSSIWMLIYSGVKKEFKNVITALKSPGGKFIVLGALLGGPVGMSCYVAAIRYIGPAYTAIISAMYPALGALLSFFFLKDKMRPAQVLGLALSISGVIALGYSPSGSTAENFPLGFLCAVLCCVGWASEGVICTYGMKKAEISNANALQIRQITSALFYGIILMPILKGWGTTVSIIPTKASGIILISALFGTVSYLCYYKALAKLGPSKAMPLNITYSAWSILFSLLLLHIVPDVKSIICAIVIVGGSLLAATEKSKQK